MDSQNKSAKKIITLLYNQGMIKTWYRDKPEGWILKSTIWSPFYINLRSIGSNTRSAEILTLIGQAMGQIVKEELPEVTKLVGVYLAGIPISTAITMTSGIPTCFMRSKSDKKLKEYGQHETIEGDIVDGDHIVIIDDLVTKFDTKLDAKKQICDAINSKGCENVICNDVLVLLDREQGANEVAKANGMNLLSLIPFKTKGISWLKNKMDDVEYSVITEYLKDDSKYQDKKIQKDLKNMVSKKD